MVWQGWLIQGVLVASAISNSCGHSYGGRRPYPVAQPQYFNRMSSGHPVVSQQWPPMGRMQIPSQQYASKQVLSQGGFQPQAAQYPPQPQHYQAQPQQQSGQWPQAQQAQWGQPQITVQNGQVQQQQPAQQNGFNVPGPSLVVEQPPPPKVIFMPPEVHYGPPPKELLEKQTKTVLMCKGKPHTVTGDHHFYSCCGDKLYYWKTEECRDGVVYPTGKKEGTLSPPERPSPPPASTSATTSIVCNGSSFMVAAAERGHYACCGSSLYDMRSSSCHLNEYSEPSDSNNSQSLSICPLNFLCCDGYTPIPNGDDKYDCCPGAGPYNRKTQQCVPV